MRSTKLFSAVFFLTAIVLFSCKNDPTKQKLAREWRMAAIAGKGADKFPDSIKREMYGTRFMQFTDEGEMIATGGMSRMQRGDYKLGNDGKTIYTTMNGRPSDTMYINKLTDDSLILWIKRAELEITWIPK